MKFHKKIFVLCMVFCLFFLSSCNKKEENQPIEATQTASKVTIGFYDVRSYNPLLVKTDYNRQCFSLIFDSLYDMDENFRPVENLASELYLENGGSTASLRIKNNVKFHDGSELTAHDVAESINFIINSEDNYYKYNVRNISSATAQNDYTVVIQLNSPAVNIKQQLTFPIVSATDLASHDFPLNGSGAYKLKSENSGKEINLELNKNYHREFETKITDIVIEIVPDLMTARSLAGSGIVDTVFASFYDEGLKTVTKLQSSKNDYPTDEYTFIQLNYDNPLMYLKPFRNALSQCVDREKLKSDAFMSHGNETVLPVNPVSWVDTASYVTKRNLSKAKEILKEMGYEDIDGDNILDYTREEKNNKTTEEITVEKELSEVKLLPKRLSFKVLFLNSTLKTAIFGRLQKDFHEAGIELVACCVDNYEEFYEKYTNKEYDLCIATTNTGYDIDLGAFMSVSGIYGSPLELGYENALSKLSSTTEEDLKKQIYKQLCDKFYDTMPHIPLMFLNKTLIKNNKLNPDGNLFLNSIYYKILQK